MLLLQQSLLLLLVLPADVVDDEGDGVDLVCCAQLPLYELHLLVLLLDLLLVDHFKVLGHSDHRVVLELLAPDEGDGQLHVGDGLLVSL